MCSEIVIVVEQEPCSQRRELLDNYGGARALRVSKTKKRKLPAQIGSNIRFNEEENTICSFGK